MAISIECSYLEAQEKMAVQGSNQLLKGSECASCGRESNLGLLLPVEENKALETLLSDGVKTTHVSK